MIAAILKEQEGEEINSKPAIYELFENGVSIGTFTKEQLTIEKQETEEKLQSIQDKLNALQAL